VKGRCAVTLLALLASGCITEAYCFSSCEDGVGGEPGDGGSGGEGGMGGGFSTSNFMPTGGMDCGDTSSSLENCGECGSICDLAGATPICLKGECLIQSCLEGQYDIDGLPETGCEYACPVLDTTVELCDGIDNDCDSLIDADDPELVTPTTLCNMTAGTPCELTQVVCNADSGWTCQYPPGVETIQGFISLTETLCDGIDGNCDGDLDEWFTALGDVCSDAALGQCKDYGVVVCDALNLNATTCNYAAPPAPGVVEAEACDGIDNDCNGFIDDALPDSAFEMALIVGGGGVSIDRFEASRPDSTAGLPGINEAVACSKPNAVPWTGGGFTEASQACAARGPSYRLCTLPESENACRSLADTNYPYGASYQATACNGVDAAPGAAVATGSTATCVTAENAFDLSGNVAEWTATQTNTPSAAPDRIFALAGGSYLSPEIGLACTIDLEPRALETTLLPNIGFRCCKDP